ncbi:hypothetical protein P7H21_16195 [Paenibacillus larvae]|nr:hypothetical protein [Paenibacillus larvae]MDT2305182.1 hypothetical protein [Paenibacillus larvae]
MQTGIKLSELHAEGYAVTKLCKLAGVARSAYYKWLKSGKPSIRELEILSLAKEVKLRYDKRKGVLGYRQIRTQFEPETQKELQQKTLLSNHARSLELKAVIRRK